MTTQGSRNGSGSTPGAPCCQSISPGRARGLELGCGCGSCVGEVLPTGITPWLFDPARCQVRSTGLGLAVGCLSVCRAGHGFALAAISAIWSLASRGVLTQGKKDDQHKSKGGQKCRLRGDGTTSRFPSLT